MVTLHKNRQHGSLRLDQNQRGYGWRYLNQFKKVGDKVYQLHATRGWKRVS